MPCESFTSVDTLCKLSLLAVFVETLDKCFRNVCELDIVFNYTKVVFSSNLVYYVKAYNLVLSCELTIAIDTYLEHIMS